MSDGVEQAKNIVLLKNWNLYDQVRSLHVQS